MDRPAEWWMLNHIAIATVLEQIYIYIYMHWKPSLLTDLFHSQVAKARYQPTWVLYQCMSVNQLSTWHASGGLHHAMIRSISCDLHIKSWSCPFGPMIRGLFQQTWRWYVWRIWRWEGHAGRWLLVGAEFPLPTIVQQVCDASVQKGQGAQQSKLAAGGLGQIPNS